MRIKGKTYQDRVMNQGLLWINGISIHNYQDGECCPDFSCCHPELFEKDKRIREKMYWRSMERKNLTSHLSGSEKDRSA